MVVLYIESSTPEFKIQLKTPVKHPTWITIHSASVSRVSQRTLKEEGLILHKDQEDPILKITAGNYTINCLKKVFESASSVKPAVIQEYVGSNVKKLWLKKKAYLNPALRELLGISDVIEGQLTTINWPIWNSVYIQCDLVDSDSVLSWSQNKLSKTGCLACVTHPVENRFTLSTPIKVKAKPVECIHSLQFNLVNERDISLTPQENLFKATVVIE